MPEPAREFLLEPELTLDVPTHALPTVAAGLLIPVSLLEVPRYGALLAGIPKVTQGLVHVYLESTEPETTERVVLHAGEGGLRCRHISKRWTRQGAVYRRLESAQDITADACVRLLNETPARAALVKSKCSVRFRRCGVNNGKVQVRLDKMTPFDPANPMRRALPFAHLEFESHDPALSPESLHEAYAQVVPGVAPLKRIERPKSEECAQWDRFVLPLRTPQALARFVSTAAELTRLNVKPSGSCPRDRFADHRDDCFTGSSQ